MSSALVSLQRKGSGLRYLCRESLIYPKMIGAKLGNYRILEKIGAGGQGTVYKATDTKLGRPVVIKVLPPEQTVKEANLKRFEREARLASALDHPNICTIFDLNDIDGVHFIAMQFIDGKNVRELVNGRPLDLRSALSITIQVADALAAAHSRGIIHRDIKAGNVMVTPVGQVKILDFGLAKLLDDSGNLGGIHHTDLTEVGIPYGTATYAAPEQARGERVDAHRQMRPMRLQGADGQQHHGPRAIEGVERGCGHLFQSVHAQKLLPFVAASHSLFARSSSPMMICRSTTSRRAAAPCVAASRMKRRRLRNRPAPAM